MLKSLLSLSLIISSSFCFASQNPEIRYSQSFFEENQLNNGSIGNSIAIQIHGLELSIPVGQSFGAGEMVRIKNIPAGLTFAGYVLTKDTILLSLLGNSKSHDTVSDISNFSLEFGTKLFKNIFDTNDIKNIRKEDIQILFND